MLRSLAFASLSLSLLTFGCSNNDTPTPPHPPVVTGDDMADGTGGNGGDDMAMSMGGGDAGNMGGDMGPALPDLAGLPAPDHDPKQHPPVPTFANPDNTNTIHAPEVWTVVWKGDDAIGAQVNKFTDAYLKSTMFTNGVKEYGISAGSGKGVLALTTAPPKTIDASQFGALVDNNVGKTSGWPASSANLIISFVVDPKTSVTQNGQAGSCVQFDGYHSVSPKGTPYLVNAYCPDAMGNPDFQNLTVTVSHEAAEASTDPTPNFLNPVNSAIDSVTNQPYLGGGELGDLCISLNTTFKSPAGDSYMVQRLYSNQIAMAGNDDPCQPGDGPYFGAGLYGTDPQDPHVVSVNRVNGTGTVTIKIEPFAYDASVGPIGFYVAGSLVPAGVKASPNILRSRDAMGNVVGTEVWGNPGSTTTVTITVDSTFSSQDVGNPFPFLVVAHNADKSRYQIWWGTMVVNN